MIRRPGRLANGVGAPVATDAARAHAVALGQQAGLDLGLARANVVRAGGDADLFGAALAVGLDAWSDAGGTGAAGAVVELAAIAGWRAGVLALRGDALARIGERRFDASLRSGVAAALGFETGAVLDEFLDRQLTDRYWWPGRHRVRGYVAAVGGFAGFGDAWIAPADEWRALPGAGAFALHSAEEWWRLDADVWGTRLVRLPAEPAPDGGDAASAASDAAGASIVLRGDSHLAWLHVREPA
ncbi:hypothetical protein [Agromyces cerinus]|uniref:Uncharacterized protein n=1 Tax=Agromyces cerinus subsp. cerinus TaxID=232089 RepID=A0A1N6HTN9_9MICO|nr:hypothetical protein [Agromyces cerinus]SIO23157.1 hypothetical protein SAMN05443544_3495 [Agromyces cerinus subsp. cerinus]